MHPDLIQELERLSLRPKAGKQRCPKCKSRTPSLSLTIEEPDHEGDGLFLEGCKCRLEDPNRAVRAKTSRRMYRADFSTPKFVFRLLLNATDTCRKNDRWLPASSPYHAALPRRSVRCSAVPF